MTAAATLLTSIGLRAHASAAIIDGVLDPSTISDSQRITANLTLIRHKSIQNLCRDPGCDCALKALASHLPQARIVPVEVTANV